jgi:hypothetical protein
VNGYGPLPLSLQLALHPIKQLAGNNRLVMVLDDDRLDLLDLVPFPSSDDLAVLDCMVLASPVLEPDKVPGVLLVLERVP